MNLTWKLDERLQAIAAMVPRGKTIADIGTDHAYLPVYLIKTGHIAAAIASDLHEGPYRAAKKTVLAAGLEQSIDVRLGAGLEIIAPYEAEILVMAGMGGSNMINILSEKREVAASFERLILQPMTYEAGVREYLTNNGWGIVDETLCLSDRKIYQIIAAEKNPASQIDPVFFEVGPKLWEARHPLLKIMLAEQIAHFKSVARSMQKSAAPETKLKRAALEKKIKELEEKFSCL